MFESRAAVVTRRIMLKANAMPKPSAIRCKQCGEPMITERRALYRCEACRDAADDGAAPKVAA